MTPRSSAVRPSCRYASGDELSVEAPAPYPFVVSHANSYTGYAVTQALHPRGKIDPTSVMANNGPRYGRIVEEAAVDLLEAQWGERDMSVPLLSPAVREGLGSERRKEEAAAVARERRELVTDSDTTMPQTRRFPGPPGAAVFRFDSRRRPSSFVVRLPR